MRNLLNFLAQSAHWFLFLLLEACAFVLLFQFNSYQGSVYFTSANALAGKVLGWQAELTDFFYLKERNESLTVRNLVLEKQLSAMKDRVQSLTSDVSAAKKCGRGALLGYRLITAKVVAASLDKPNNLITIDRGSLDGVRPDMGVASGNGVVGVVYMTGKHYSVVIPVLNKKSNISVMIEKRGYYGYLHWNSGAADIAYVDDVPRHARFRIGDKIVTSGYSSIFPKGVLVGQVQRVYNSRDGLSYRLKVKLSTNFASLRNVCVIDDEMMRERIDLMRQAKDSLMIHQNDKNQ